MWQRFTERARRVILLGQEEAAEMNSGRVGTEHLLLGLMRDPGSVAGQLFQRKSVSLEQVRQKIEAEAQPGSESVGTEPKLTPKAKRVLELAADEARRMKHNYIGTEHLLLALLREKDGDAARILASLGLELEAARELVLEILGSETASEPASRSSRSRHNLSVPEAELYERLLAEKDARIADLQAQLEAWQNTTTLLKEIANALRTLAPPAPDDQPDGSAQAD